MGDLRGITASEWTLAYDYFDPREEGLREGLTSTSNGYFCTRGTFARVEAGDVHYPALLLGSPWWFFDSPLGMRRYLDSVMETAGLYNTAGFNDDTRAFASIPARHDVWRRVTCNWLAGAILTDLVDEEDARDMARQFAHHLARRAYGLERDPVGRA